MGLEIKGLELLNNRPSVGSLSDSDQFSTDEMYQFLMNSQNITDLLIINCEEFLGEFLRSKSKNIHLEDSIHDLLVKFYEDTYINTEFRKSFTENLPNLTIVLNKVTQYGRYQIGTELFGSAIASHHIKSSYLS